MLSGNVVSEWRAGYLVRLLVAFLALLIFGIAGIALVAARDGGANAVGVALLVAAIGSTAFVWWQQSGLTLRVRTDGIEVIGRMKSKAIPWTRLSGFRYIPQQRNSGYGAGGLVGVLIVAAIEAATSNSNVVPPMGLVLNGDDGTKIRVTNVYKNHVQIIHMLTSTASEQLWPRLLERYNANDRIEFGKRVAIRRSEGISCKGIFGGVQTVSLDRLDPMAMIEGRAFVLRSAGKVICRVDLGQVPSVFALVRMLNHLRSPGNVAGAPPSSTGAVQVG